MSLREVATADFNTLIATDFGIAITVTNPAGDELNTMGYTTDIAQVIDPDTGQIVSGRHASIAISQRVLEDAAFGIPIGIADAAIKPWLVSFDDLEGNTYVFKVLSSNPDRAIGSITCELEFFV